MHECIVASRHLVITEGHKVIYMVGVKLQDLWEIDGNYMYYVECGFLVIEAHEQMFVVEAKNSYIIDEYTKFGSIATMELLGKIQEADIYEEFQIAYKRMRGA